MHAHVPCPACRRHVRASDVSCPFCAKPLPSDLAARAVPANNGRRLNRSALFAFAATLTVTGCGASVEPGQSGDTGIGDARSDGSPDDGGNVALYGAPADTGVLDTGGPAPAYGLPPEDTGTDTRTDAKDDTKDDDGGAAPAYGLPADAG